jgi:hypothetical protein
MPKMELAAPSAPLGERYLGDRASEAGQGTTVTVQLPRLLSKEVSQ